MISCVIVLALFLSFNAMAQNSNEQLSDNALPFVNYDQNDNVDYFPNDNKGLMTSDYCDDFSVPNTTTIDGWTEVTGDWQIVDNMLQTPGGFNQQITLDGSSQADGIITVRGLYTGAAGVRYVGIMARYTSASSKILFKIQDNASTGNWNKYFVYLPDGSINGEGDFGTDAIFQIEYVGADITIRIDSDRDGIWDHTNSTTTTYLSDGLCGIEGYSTANVDAFCLGEYNVTPPSPTVPVSNWAIILGFFTIIIITVVRFVKF